MNAFLEVAASNCAVALALAVLAGVLARCRVNPHVVHVVWLMVLVKLFTPPLVWIDLPQPSLAEEPPIEDVVISAPLLVLTPTDQATMPLPPEVAAPTWSWREWLLAVWGAGTLAFVFSSLLRILSFRSLLRKAERGPAELEELAHRLSRQMGLRHCPQIVVLPIRITPAVWSLFGRPRIVLPRELASEMRPDQMETILAHELAHIRRGDHWVRLLELAATTVFWWNPLVWWVRKNLREMEEHCCDSLVLETLPGAARRYAIALIETVEFLSQQPGRLPIGATAARPTVTLTRRIQMLKNGPSNRRLSIRGLALVLGLLLAPMSLAFAQIEKPIVTELKTKVYHLRNLDSKKMEQELRRQIAPKDWAQAGGPNSMRRTRTGELVITASPAVHEQIELFMQLSSLDRKRAELQKKLSAMRENVFEIRVSGPGPEPMVAHSGVSVALSHFDALLRMEKEEGVDPKRVTVVIHADSNVPTGSLRDLIRKCQQAGFEKFAFGEAKRKSNELGLEGVEFEFDRKESMKEGAEAGSGGYGSMSSGGDGEFGMMSGGGLKRMEPSPNARRKKVGEQGGVGFHDLDVLDLAFDKDGKLLATGKDGHVRIWNIDNSYCSKCHRNSVWKDLGTPRGKKPGASEAGGLSLDWSRSLCPAAAEQKKSQLLIRDKVIEQQRKALKAWIEAGEALKNAEAVRPDDDATLLRRIHLDLLGTLPTQKEVSDFVKDKSPDKRRTKIEELLTRGSKSGKQQSSQTPRGAEIIERLVRERWRNDMQVNESWQQLLNTPVESKPAK